MCVKFYNFLFLSDLIFKYLYFIRFDLYISRFSMFNHPEVTRELLEINKGDFSKEELCRNIAKPGYEIVAAIPSPRFIKSHFPFSMLPGILDTGCKVIAETWKILLVNIVIPWHFSSRLFTWLVIQKTLLYPGTI